MTQDMLVEYVVATIGRSLRRSSHARCTTETATGLWRVKRGDDQPKQQALDTRTIEDEEVSCLASELSCPPSKPMCTGLPATTGKPGRSPVPVHGGERQAG